MKNAYVITFSLLLMLVSCNKDDDNIVGSDRSKALLGQWEYAAIITDRAVDINGDGIVNIDLFNSQEIRQCVKDNKTFFTARGEGEKGDYVLNNNGLLCTQEGPFPDFEEDRYELIENDIIRFDSRNEMRIIEFTSNKLIVDTDSNFDNTDVILTITYSK